VPPAAAAGRELTQQKTGEQLGSWRSRVQQQADNQQGLHGNNQWAWQWSTSLLCRGSGLRCTHCRRLQGGAVTPAPAAAPALSAAAAMAVVAVAAELKEGGGPVLPLRPHLPEAEATLQNPGEVPHGRARSGWLRGHGAGHQVVGTQAHLCSSVVGERNHLGLHAARKRRSGM
jgi:hypothetical protein